jgi:hypothetical protein
MVTENTKHVLRAAKPRPAYRPPVGWPPEGHIVMTPKRPSNYYSFSVCLIMASTYRKHHPSKFFSDIKSFMSSSASSTRWDTLRAEVTHCGAGGRRLEL